MDASEISSLVMDESFDKILTGANNHAKSAAQLSIESGIPMDLCFEKIELLEELGLLTRIDTRLDNNGDRIDLYKSELKKAFVFHDNGNIKVKLVLKSGLIKEY